jgi:hypothetical protein
MWIDVIDLSYMTDGEQLERVDFPSFLLEQERMNLTI